MGFEIVDENVTENIKFNLSRIHLTFKLTEIPEDVANPEDWVKQQIEEIVEYILKLEVLDDEDKIGFTFASEGYFEHPFYIPFRKVADTTFEHVWNLLGQIYQSNAEGFHSNTFRITMARLKTFRGAGKVSTQHYNSYEEECRAKRSIIEITSNDNLCLPRALVVAKAYCDKNRLKKAIRENRNKMQDVETRKLLEESGIQIPENGAGEKEIELFQEHLSQYKISVYDYDHKGRKVLFEGPDAPNEINLLYYKNHYNVITSLTGAFSCGYYCEKCHIPYNTKNNHRCRGSCPCCQEEPPCVRTPDEITCDDCNRQFRSQSCYDNHKASGSGRGQTLCESVKKCPQCKKTFRASRKHECNEIYCKTCGKFHDSEQYCFIPCDKKKPSTEKILFVFYDLECRQEIQGAKGNKIHVPNLCVFQQRCVKCIDIDQAVEICKDCCQRQQVLEKNPIERFMNYLLEVRKRYKHIIVVAHNGKAYDHQFILRHLLENTQLNVKVIMKGTCLLLMQVRNVKFIDSINYFPMALSALPKTFGLSLDLKKGFFPHLFNTKENENYIGPLPDVEYYGVDHMNEEERLEVLKWHNENKNKSFNLKQELKDYCICDVKILTDACLNFRKMFLDQCGVCPFSEAITIASACNLVFRRKYLRPNTIGLIPRKLYRFQDNQSKIAMLWLIYEEENRNIIINSSMRGKESKIGQDKVDGYCEETREIFEFHGCFYHGHSCISADPDSKRASELEDRRNRTKEKTERLRKNGYKVIEKWECEFKAMLRDKKNLSEELRNNPLYSSLPLNPRDAFYGGRTGNTKTHYRIKPGEKIKYVDVCSLYPWVCKYGKFPIGHPKVLVGDQCHDVCLGDINGLVKCKILPPQQLYHPVLPLKMNDKLMFVLCRTCGSEMNQGECYHGKEERSLTGTWVIDEVNKALEMGYKMLEIYEIWQYEIERYNPKERTGGLFREMMDKFIQIKQQASGWPEQCKTVNERSAYIEDFFKKEGIRMKHEDVVKNPGLRSLSKLMLTSFWGKFGQNENQTKTKIIRQPSELYKLVRDSDKQVMPPVEINADTQIVCWKYEEDSEAGEVLPTVNVCMAAYTTTQARLKLYSYLERLGDRVLYYDTDSVVYVSRPGEWDVPVGSSLGEMTDELETYGTGSYIVEFVSGGPKNYSYILFSPEYHTYYTVCKVKGLRLNFDVMRMVNFFSMKDMVSRSSTETLCVPIQNIRRTKDHTIVTKNETKKYRVNSAKRKFHGAESVPYGYKKLCSETCSVSK